MVRGAAPGIAPTTAQQRLGGIAPANWNALARPAAALLVLLAAAARARLVALGPLIDLDGFDRRRQRFIVVAGELFLVLLLALLTVVKALTAGVIVLVHFA